MDAAYGYKGDKDDAPRIAFLFGFYQLLTAPSHPQPEQHWWSEPQGNNLKRGRVRGDAAWRHGSTRLGSNKVQSSVSTTEM